MLCMTKSNIIWIEEEERYDDALTLVCRQHGEAVTAAGARIGAGLVGHGGPADHSWP